MPASERFKEVLDEMWDLHIKKNAGYAGCSDDPFANFRYAELFDVSAFKGCLIRLSDKYIRIANLVRNPANEQVGESIKDTLKDLANYAVIALCLYEQTEAEMEKNYGGGLSTIETNIEVGNEYSKETILRGERNLME